MAYDVVVAGPGNAALCPAPAASEAGASVLGKAAGESAAADIGLKAK